MADMADIATLGIKIDSNGVTIARSELDKLTKTGKGAEQQTDKLGKTSKTTSRSMATLGNAAKTAAAGLLAYASASTVLTSARQARELENMARLSGVTIERFQALALAAGAVGFSGEKLGDVFKDVQDKIGDFLQTGGGEFADYFENIAPLVGQTAEEFRNLSGPDALIKIQQGLEAANLSAAETTFYLEAIANDAALLSPLLANNGAAFEEAAKRADELNIVLSEFEIDQLTEVEKASREMFATFGNGADKIIAEYAPELIAGMNAVSEAVGDLTEFIQENRDTIEDTVVIVGTATAAFVAYKSAVFAAQVATTVFNRALYKNPLVLISAGAVLLASQVSDLDEKLSGLADTIRELLGFTGDGIEIPITGGTGVTLPEISIESEQKWQDQLAAVFELVGEDAATAIGAALVDGDWQNVGDVIGASLAGGIGSQVSSALTQSLGAGAAGVVGGFAGGLAGAAISSLLAGKQETGRSTNVSLSGGNVSGFNQTNYSSLFGSSSSRSALGSSDISALGNSIALAQSTVTRALSNMGFGLSVAADEFSATVKVDGDDLSASVESLTEAFVNANVAYIEDFQRVTETAVETLQRLSEVVSSVEDSFTIVGGTGLISSVESFIQQQADAINEVANDAYQQGVSRLASAQAAYQQALQAFQDTRNADEDVRDAATVALRDARQAVKDAENALPELFSRLGTGLELATVEFSNSVNDTLAEIYGITTDDASDLLVQLANNYEDNFYTAAEQVARAQERARSELEQFADLGVSADMSLVQFRTAFEAVINAGTLSGEEYAQWLSAADALNDFYAAAEDVDTSGALESITDFVRDLMGLADDGTQTLASAKLAYEQALSAAIMGDQDALDSITKIAQTYLDVAGDSVSTSAQLAAIRSSITGDLSSLIGGIPAYANGTDYHQGGLAIVGDGGEPEIVNLPRGSSVTPMSDVAKMGNSTELLTAINQLLAVTKSGLMAVSKNTAKTANTLDDWDGIGIPETRDVTA